MLNLCTLLQMKEKKSFHEIINSEKPVLVDFFATWCGPCNMMQPILQELAARIKDRASIIKIDVDKKFINSCNVWNSGSSYADGFKQGKVVWRQSGVMNANQLEDVITNFSTEPVVQSHRF